MIDKKLREVRAADILRVTFMAQEERVRAMRQLEVRTDILLPNGFQEVELLQEHRRSYRKSRNGSGDVARQGYVRFDHTAASYRHSWTG
jgi:hypothetical protein